MMRYCYRFILRLLLLAGIFCEFPFSANAVFRYRLLLDGKPGSVVYPLSRRALERRERQGIPLDSADYEVSPLYLSAIEAAGMRICSRSRWLNSVVVMREDGGEIAGHCWDEFPFVRQVTEVTSYENVAVPTTAVTKRGVTDVTARTAADDFRQPMWQVNGQELYDAGHRGAGMLIAVLDGGFYNVNQLEWLNRRVVGCHDMYRPGYDGELYTGDTHGTQVLSLMATDSTQGIWGTACEADYFLIRSEYSPTETPFEEDQWVAAAELADSLGADLINSSLGYMTFDNAGYNHTHDELGQESAFITRGANCAAAKGILVCCAAGNERQSSWGAITFPAEASGILAVAATDDEGEPASFTSPGFLIPYVKPDVACRGFRAYVVNCYTGLPTMGSGTSFASPFLCGLAASLWSAAPCLTAVQIRRIICESASRFSAPDELLGYGLPDFAAALSEALRLQSELDGIAPLRPDVSSELGGGQHLPVVIHDLFGRPLKKVPPQGCYIENGKLKYILKH